MALAGIAVNGAATAALAGAGRESHMSIEGSFQHILTDLFAFIGTALAGGVILLTGFERADPIASLPIAALMLRSAVGLLRASGRIFLEAAPPGLDPQEIGHALAAHPGVVEVHDLHVWELSAGFPALSAHVLVAPDADCHAARRALQELLRGALRRRAHHAAGRARGRRGTAGAGAARGMRATPRLRALGRAGVFALFRPTQNKNKT